MTETEYNIVRSDRRTVGLYINDDGSLTVRAPRFVTRAEIGRIVESRHGWIEKHARDSAGRAAKKAAFAPAFGQTCLFRGHEYPLAAREGRFAGFDGKTFFAPPELDGDRLKKALVAVYRKLAGEYITGRVAALAAAMDEEPVSVGITSAKRRWGSCSASGRLNFAWRLVLADDDAVDSVVVHELAHLSHLDHGPAFWKTVRDFMPDYDDRRKSLSVLAARLAAEDWD